MGSTTCYLGLNQIMRNTATRPTLVGANGVISGNLYLDHYVFLGDQNKYKLV